MKKALLISSSAQSAEQLSVILGNEGYMQIKVANTSDDSRRLSADDEFDLICINAPINGENGIELSKHFARTTRACVVIIVPQKNADFMYDALTEENEKLKNMVEDMKVINRAKLLLITCLNMSEEQAHRYIEKHAMDLRTSRLQIAKQIIRTYEN